MERISGSVILTASGRYVDPLDLRPEDVSLDDVAHALANQARYSGHTSTLYSVAEHSVRVARFLHGQGEQIDVVRWGLLHDASEAYLVDLPRPLKAHPVFGAVYREAEDRAMLAVCEAFGLAPGMPDAVKNADLVLLATERRDLMPPNGEWTILDGVDALPGTIEPWSPEDAEAAYLSAFEFLYPETAKPISISIAFETAPIDPMVFARMFDVSPIYLGVDVADTGDTTVVAMTKDDDGTVTMLPPIVNADPGDETDAPEPVTVVEYARLQGHDRERAALALGGKVFDADEDEIGYLDFDEALDDYVVVLNADGVAFMEAIYTAPEPVTDDEGITLGVVVSETAYLKAEREGLAFDGPVCLPSDMCEPGGCEPCLRVAAAGLDPIETTIAEAKPILGPPLAPVVPIGPWVTVDEAHVMEALPPIPPVDSSKVFSFTTADTKPTNPKDVVGSDKLPLHLWPETATATGCLGMLDGALKYGRSNFRETGVRASIYVDALRRHVNAWNEGEDLDPDSGVPHLGHALACLAIIVDAEAAGMLVDDRQYPGGYRRLIERLTPHVPRLKAKHSGRDPRHFTIADGSPSTESA